jgi:hypothetical protein
MTDQTHHISVVRRSDGETRTAVLEASTSAPWGVSIDLDDSTYSAEGIDLFAAFLELRRKLESNGVLVCCAGALPNVWPSGMSISMSGGRLAYRLYPDRRSTTDDLVDIFDPADCRHVVSVGEQRSTTASLLQRPE